MSFLAPALLAGLLAIAIPIVVHLVQRERKRVVEFPSLMFLRRIPYQSMRRRAIRNWPLLLLRCLAFALIVLAFARPLLRGARLQGGAAGGGREVVILLDRSFSMGYDGRWDRARAEARRAVQALSPDDRATLVFFAADVEVAVRSTADRGALLAAIDRARVGFGATRYTPALRAAAGLLEASDRPRREAILVSDFQRSGWDRSSDVKLPEGAILTTVPVAGQEAAPENAYVAGVSVDREQAGGRDRVTLAARVVNRGASPITDREVTLEAGGRRLETRRVSVGAGEAAVVTFAPFAAPSGAMRATVRLAPDALPVDDVFHAVVAAAVRVPVLVVESPNPSPDASLYLLHALGIGGAPAFDAVTRSVDRVTSGDLAAARVIVLNDTQPPAGPVGRQLLERVKGGAGLLVVLGEHSGWPESGLDLLPGGLGGSTDRSGSRGGTLGYVDYSHPVLEIFSTPHSGDLTAARFFRYRQLNAPAGVLARFDDGAVALAERRVGDGTVLAFASTFDSYWNDLALKPVFLPLVHRAIAHLARHVEPKAWYAVGETFDPAAIGQAGTGARATAVVALTPSGGRVTVDRGAPTGPFVFDEQGFYEFRGTGEPAVVAVNVDPTESDLSPMDPTELASAVTAGAGSTAGTVAQAPTAEEEERRQALWWYLLAAGLVVLVAELVVANRLPRIA